MKGRHLNYECSNKIAVKAVLIFVLSVCPLSLLKIVMSDGRSVSQENFVMEEVQVKLEKF